MTIMAVIRRASRKSEPNIYINVQSRGSSPRRYSAFGISGGGVENGANHRRHRYWCCRSRQRCTVVATTPPPTHSLSPTIASIHRRESFRQLWNRFIYLIKRSNPVHVVIIGVICFITSTYLVHWLLVLELGPRGSIKGGNIGNFWDQNLRDYTRYKTIMKWREEVRSELHIPIVHGGKEGALREPWFYPLDVIIRTRPNSAIVEMLLREKSRLQLLDSLLQNADNIRERCSENQQYPVHIPPTVVQLQPSYMQRELPPYWMARSDSFDLGFFYVKQSDIDPLLLQSMMRSCQEPNRKFSDLQCFGHSVGGLQLGDSHRLHLFRPHINTILTLMRSSQTDSPYEKLAGGTCHSRVGYAVFSNAPTPDDQLRKSSAISNHISTAFVAFPPNHFASLCIPPFEHSIGISPYDQANHEISFQSTFANKLITEIESRDINDATGAIWGLATLTCDFSDGSDDTITNCCNRVSVSILNSIDAEEISHHLKDEGGHHYLIFTAPKLIPSKVSNFSNESSAVIVKVTEVKNNNNKAPRRHKESIQTRLRNEWRCEPSWLCNRCLQTSIHGSFSKCASTCDECVANSICSEDNTNSSPFEVHVQVTGAHYSTPTTSENVVTNEPQLYRIPRIIHQTYFEEITMEKYPQLFRLQNTWRASGWEYRFYTDDTAREFIMSNYPSRFVSVFDSLTSGAYKADFFRYLVLYQVGGVYVDVDVMLDTNLDTFLTPDLAFFTPMDAVGAYADEQFCLWNGLLGSAPAHPALANVIEWMVNLVSNRGDMYDMERNVCKFSSADMMENWKVRIEPGLMLSGPCALGLAVNNALGNEPLSKFAPGLLKKFNGKKVEDLNSAAIGNVMILAADKSDLGAFRFSDSERNVIIASTDLPGLSKAPIFYESVQNLRSGKTAILQKPHYSISTSGQQLWGTHDVYADDLVEDEVITLKVSFNN